MALMLLHVLVLGVIVAAADDAPLTWYWSSRALLPCAVPDAARVTPRRPPPLLDDATRRPNPYSWRHEDAAYHSNRVLSNGTLDVRRREGGDGAYRCAVRTQLGTVLGYTVLLKTAHLEKFSGHPEDTAAREGQPTTLSCVVSSDPPATVSWSRDGKNLPADERYYLLKNQLLITDVKSSDAGMYRCTATNAFVNKSRTSHGGRLRVLDEESTDPSLLSTFEERDLMVSQGERITLPCAVAGWPRPELTWELVTPGGYTSVLDATDQVLERSDMDSNQEGIYTCRVKGRSYLQKSFNVTVTRPANITLPPASKEALRASTVRFSCSADGRPAPNVTWYKDGAPLALTGRIGLRKSYEEDRIELVISGVTSHDAGVYQCFARNNVSEVSAWATLSVTGKGAAPPDQVACEPMGAREVAVRWMPVPEKVFAYTVHTTPQEKPGMSLPGQPHVNTQEIVTVPKPLTPYLFQVRAYVQAASSKAASDFSEAVVCQGQGVPFKLLKLDPGSVLVSWRVFAEQTPGVVEWRVQWRAAPGGPDHNATLPASATNYTLPRKSKLDPGSVLVSWRVFAEQTPGVVEWRVQWRAAPGGPDHNATLPASATNYTLPRKSKLDPGSVLVSWRVFAEQTPGVVEWRVQWRAAPGGPDHNATLPASATNYTLPRKSKLDPGSVLVSWRVFAEQTPGVVEWRVQWRAAPGGPDHNVTLPASATNYTLPRKSKLDPGSVLVSWRVFAEQTPGVVEWRVQWRAAPGGPDHNVTLPASATNYTLPLEKDVPLQVRVLGSRSVPWLPQNLSRVPWLPADLTGDASAVPRDLTVTQVGPRGFTVRWRTDDLAPGSFGVLVCVTKVDGNEECQPSDTNSATIQNLQPDSEYEVRVLTRIPGRDQVEAVLPDHVFTLPEGSASFKLTYKYVNATTLRVSWRGEPARYNVYHTTQYHMPLDTWNIATTTGNTVLLTGIDPGGETFVRVKGSDTQTESQLLRVPPQPRDLDAKDLSYVFTSNGITVSWVGAGPRVVRFAQNITRPLEAWHRLNVTEPHVQLWGLDRSLPTYVAVTAPGSGRPAQVLSIPARPAAPSPVSLGVGISCLVCVLVLIAVGGFCFWRRRKMAQSPVRSRRRNAPPTEAPEGESSEMKGVGGRLANGAAGEPLLNGHVHITENPTSKTPNGKMRKARYEAFDVSRDDADTAAESAPDAAAAPLDTSRRPPLGKLPDDNMNSEPAPTLQPNG